MRGLILSVLVLPVAGRRSRRLSPADRGHRRAGRAQPRSGRPVPPGGPPLRWPPAGFEFEARAQRGGSLFKRRLGVLVYTLFRLSHHALRHQGRRLRAENLRAAGRGEFRLPEIRRWLADGARLHAGTRTRVERAPGGGVLGRHRAIWPAPAGCGDDDLLYPVGDAQRPRPFHRRRARRLRLGRDRVEGDAPPELSFSASFGSSLRRRRAAPTQPSTFSVPGPVTEILLA